MQSELRAIPYSSEWATKWNEFVTNSKNGTFLLNRNYMDYHADRFEDCSIIILNSEDKITALLPACRCGDTATSHGGLTYGGWILPVKHMDASLMLCVWETMSAYYKTRGINKLIYKPVPWIYPAAPSDDDLYAIFRNSGTIKTVLVSTTIDLVSPVHFNNSSRTRANKARRNQYTVERSNDYAQYWHLLQHRLASRHNAKPVHTLDEIKLLASRFPDNIELWGVFEPENKNMTAGCVIFNTGRVAHAQYTAATDHGLGNGSLPLLFSTLVAHYAGIGLRYFDFGTSNEQEGTKLNNGLIEQKQQFGGRSVAYTTFEIKL